MKTVKEWSDAFDVLFNEVMSNASASLDEYDKSIFLTKAQEEIVKNYFNPKGNKYQEGFDDNAKRQSDFATLLQVATLTASTSYAKFDSRSNAYQFPSDFFIAVNEQYQVTAGGKTYPYTIIPLSYTDYNRAMQKPYKYPPKSQVWRLITGEITPSATGYWVKAGEVAAAGNYDVDDVPEDADHHYETIAEAEADGWRFIGPTDDENVPVVEIIGRYNPSGTELYKLRYIRRPKPIILVDLNTVDNNLSINGITLATPCELPAHIHEEILQRGVELAKAAYATDQNGTIQLNNQVQTGQRSE